MRRVCTLTAALLMLAGLTTGFTRLAAQEGIKPGPEHEQLKQMEGVWEATIQSKEGDAKGTLTSKMGLGGLWLLDHFKGDFGGMSFEGRGGTSYDPAKKKYVSVWIDSMSGSPMITEGTLDKSTKTLTMHGNMPMPDGTTLKATTRIQLKDADNMLFTLNAAGPDGKDFEMMKISYKRTSK
jgi:hypothetical protein